MLLLVGYQTQTPAQVNRSADFLHFKSSCMTINRGSFPLVMLTVTWVQTFPNVHWLSQLHELFPESYGSWGEGCCTETQRRDSSYTCSLLDMHVPMCGYIFCRLLGLLRKQVVPMLPCSFCDSSCLNQHQRLHFKD